MYSSNATNVSGIERVRLWDGKPRAIELRQMQRRRKPTFWTVTGVKLCCTITQVAAVLMSAKSKADNERIANQIATMCELSQKQRICRFAHLTSLFVNVFTLAHQSDARRFADWIDLSLLKSCSF
jgi:hypothetical protein